MTKLQAMAWFGNIDEEDRWLMPEERAQPGVIIEFIMFVTPVPEESGDDECVIYYVESDFFVLVGRTESDELGKDLKYSHIEDDAIYRDLLNKVL